MVGYTPVRQAWENGHRHFHLVVPPLLSSNYLRCNLCLASVTLLRHYSPYIVLAVWFWTTKTKNHWHCIDAAIVHFGQQKFMQLVSWGLWRNCARQPQYKISQLHQMTVGTGCGGLLEINYMYCLLGPVHLRNHPICGGLLCILKLKTKFTSNQAFRPKNWSQLCAEFSTIDQPDQFPCTRERDGQWGVCHLWVGVTMEMYCFLNPPPAIT